MRALWCGVLVASAVVLAGCTGGGPAQVITAPASVATSSPAPSMGPAVGLPDKPEHWDDTGERGAKAAAVWFLRDLYRYVLETNDTTEWERLSTDDCEFCANVADRAEQARGVGEVLRLEGSTGARVTRAEELNPLAFSVLLDVDAFVIRRYSSSGERRSDGESAEGQVLVVLLREGPDWVVRAAQYFASDADVPSASETP